MHYLRQREVEVGSRVQFMDRALGVHMPLHVALRFCYSGVIKPRINWKQENKTSFVDKCLRNHVSYTDGRRGRKFAYVTQANTFPSI